MIENTKALEFNNILIVFGFLLFFNIINYLQLIGKTIIELSINIDLNRLDNIVVFNNLITINFILLLLASISLYLFLKKKKLFVTIFSFLVFISIVINIYTIIVSNIYPNISDLIRFTILFTLLIYFIKSKQVKQTFMY